jgi:hypothetical protein
MKQEADYLRSAIPEPVVLLGQRLESFSLGHLKLLMRFENAFVTAAAAPELGDLVMGVYICCQDYAGALEGLQDPNLPKLLHKWATQLGGGWWQRVLGRSGFDFDQKAAEFARYIRDGSSWPELHDPGRDYRMPGAPFIQRVEIVLRGRLGCTDDSVNNVPWGKAVRDYFAFWEMEGAVKINSPEDDEHMRQVHALIEEIKRDVAAGKVFGPTDGHQADTTGGHQTDAGGAASLPEEAHGA